MNEQDKLLLLKDLCARLPYKPHCRVFKLNEDIKENDDILYGVIGDNVMTLKSDKDECLMYYQIKPYLRPMSSMMEEEKEELKKMTCPEGTGTFDENGLIVPMSHFGDNITYKFMVEIINWLNAHHFDYNNLIEKGLALEADDVIRDELGLSPKHSEDPYKTPIHIEMLDKDGSVMSENDYLGIMLPSDNPNEINISLKPIE